MSRFGGAHGWRPFPSTQYRHLFPQGNSPSTNSEDPATWVEPHNQRGPRERRSAELAVFAISSASTMRYLLDSQAPTGTQHSLEFALE